MRLFRNRWTAFCHGVFAMMLLGATGWLSLAGGDEFLSGIIWPEPRKVDPGIAGGRPADAIVLFDGKDMSQWHGGEKWLVDAGVATARGGGITSKRAFGDCQVHVEWAAPEKIEGRGQGRGNSGVYLMGNYEVQILDSYNNPTYFDGQCGSIYKQSPPLVNASRKPGEWQSFDIVFRAPVFGKDGKVDKPACITVIHNGVVVQNNFEIQGTSAWDAAPAYKAHEPKLPLHIQYHGNPVKFRNIWVRELAREGEVKYPKKQSG
jgi:hypothetical protein